MSDSCSFVRPVETSQADGTPPASSFVAVTRMVGGEAQLLVEVDSPTHRGLYHAIGGKSEPGESSRETANRELMEEVLIVGGWAILHDSHLLGTLHHPSLHQGVPIGPRSYYLYPEEVREVRSKGVKVAWVPLANISAFNSTTALQQLVFLLRKDGVPNDHVFTREGWRRLHFIQEKSLSLSSYHADSSRQWADVVEEVELRVFFNWMDQWDLSFLVVFGSDQDEASGERVTSAVINRLARALDRKASKVVRRILSRKITLASGMAELARLIGDTQDKIGPFLTNRGGLRVKYNGLTGFEFRGLGLVGNIGKGEVQHRSFDPKSVPFGIAEGLEVLLETIGLEEIYW